MMSRYVRNTFEHYCRHRCAANRITNGITGSHGGLSLFLWFNNGILLFDPISQQIKERKKNFALVLGGTVFQ